MAIKIVASFCDPEHNGSSAFLWGLGEDGELYWSNELPNQPPNWWIVSKRYQLSFDMKTMLRIVRKFNHLLVWL
jgi:hypothetical protein